MNFQQFVDKVDNFYYDHSFELRYGQSLMNILHKVWPEKYKEISKTDYDCFYDDGITKMTLEKLEKEWLN